MIAQQIVYILLTLMLMYIQYVHCIRSEPYLFHLSKDSKEVQPDNLLQVVDCPLSRGVESRDQLNVLGHVFEAGRNTKNETKKTK